MGKVIIATAVAALALVGCQSRLGATRPAAQQPGGVEVTSGVGVKVPPELYPDRNPQSFPPEDNTPSEPPALSAPDATPSASRPLSRPSSYQPYSSSAYQQAKAAGQPIFLYFYANWCSLCRPQEPVVVELFGTSEVAAMGVAGFRVNYNDNETDADEQALARELGVNYQHTFLTFTADGRQVWRATGTQTREQLKARLAEIQ